MYYLLLKYYLHNMYKKRRSPSRMRVVATFPRNVSKIAMLLAQSSDNQVTLVTMRLLVFFCAISCAHGLRTKARMSASARMEDDFEEIEAKCSHFFHFRSRTMKAGDHFIHGTPFTFTCAEATCEYPDTPAFLAESTLTGLELSTAVTRHKIKRLLEAGETVHMRMLLHVYVAKEDIVVMDLTASNQMDLLRCLLEFFKTSGYKDTVLETWFRALGMRKEFKSKTKPPLIDRTPAEQMQKLRKEYSCITDGQFVLDSKIAEIFKDFSSRGGPWSAFDGYANHAQQMGTEWIVTRSDMSTKFRRDLLLACCDHADLSKCDMKEIDTFKMLSLKLRQYVFRNSDEAKKTHVNAAIHNVGHHRTDFLRKYCRILQEVSTI